MPKVDLLLTLLTLQLLQYTLSQTTCKVANCLVCNGTASPNYQCKECSFGYDLSNNSTTAKFSTCELGLIWYLLVPLAILLTLATVWLLCLFNFFRSDNKETTKIQKKMRNLKEDEATKPREMVSGVKNRGDGNDKYQRSGTVQHIPQNQPIQSPQQQPQQQQQQPPQQHQQKPQQQEQRTTDKQIPPKTPEQIPQIAPAIPRVTLQPESIKRDTPPGSIPSNKNGSPPQNINNQPTKDNNIGQDENVVSIKNVSVTSKVDLKEDQNSNFSKAIQDHIQKQPPFSPNRLPETQIIAPQPTPPPFSQPNQQKQPYDEEKRAPTNSNSISFRGTPLQPQEYNHKPSQNNSSSNRSQPYKTKDDLETPRHNPYTPSNPNSQNQNNHPFAQSNMSQVPHSNVSAPDRDSIMKQDFQTIKNLTPESTPYSQNKNQIQQPSDFQLQNSSIPSQRNGLHLRGLNSIIEESKGPQGNHLPIQFESQQKPVSEDRLPNDFGIRLKQGNPSKFGHAQQPNQESQLQPLHLKSMVSQYTQGGQSQAPNWLHTPFNTDFTGEFIQNGAETSKEKEGITNIGLLKPQLEMVSKNRNGIMDSIQGQPLGKNLEYASSFMQR